MTRRVRERARDRSRARDRWRARDRSIRWLLGLVHACWITPAYARSTPTPTTTVQPGVPEPGVPGISTQPRDEPPTWRFRKSDKSVKVVVLAGSIGAWPHDPYARVLERMCSNVEMKNLSKTGLGARMLKRRFREQVLDNPRVDVKKPGLEHWLVFQGGLNSVGIPERTNKDIRELVVLAHQRGFRVVLMSLTPWGDESDRSRWAGTAGLRYFRATRKVVDFVLGASSAREALGHYASERPDGPDAGWRADERPEVAIDLYDSQLRDREAPIRDLQAMRRALELDPRLRKILVRLSPERREETLRQQASLASEIPRWYLRRDLRSFDHMHPNREGHRIIADVACPALPGSWGCVCSRPDPDPAPTAGSDSAP